MFICAPAFPLDVAYSGDHEAHRHGALIEFTILVVGWRFQKLESTGTQPEAGERSDRLFLRQVFDHRPDSPTLRPAYTTFSVTSTFPRVAFE